MSCPDRNLAVFHHCRRYEGLRLLPSVCEKIIIQQTLIRLCPLSLLIILICFSAKLYWEVRQTAAEVGEKVDFVKNSSTFNL